METASSDIWLHGAHIELLVRESLRATPEVLELELEFRCV